MNAICMWLQDCEESGQDYDRVKVLDISATDAEKWDRAKQRKKNPDQGFAGFCFSYSIEHLLLLSSKGTLQIII